MALTPEQNTELAEATADYVRLELAASAERKALRQQNNRAWEADDRAVKAQQRVFDLVKSYANLPPEFVR